MQPLVISLWEFHKKLNWNQLSKLDKKKKTTQYYFLACAQYSATPLSVLECAMRCESRVFGVGRDCQVPFMCQLLWLLSQNASFGEMLLAFWHVAYVVRACLECVRCQSAVSFVSVWGAQVWRVASLHIRPVGSQRRKPNEQGTETRKEEERRQTEAGL